MSEMDRKIRDARKRLGMTQGDFASALGVTQSTVSRWENGAQTPDLAAVMKMAELAGSDPFEFSGSHLQSRENLPIGTNRIYLSGCIAENAYSTEPDVGGEGFIIVSSESFSHIINRKIRAYELIDESGLPYFPMASIVLVVENYGKIAADDIVVITVDSGNSSYRTMIKKTYIDAKGDVIFASMNPNPYYYSSFRLSRKDTQIDSFSPFRVSENNIRGVVAASLTIHNRDRFASER